MTGTAYNVNDLLEVVVEAGVHEQILRDVNFQIGYFKVPSSTTREDLPRIVVRSFSEWNGSAVAKETATIFYTASGQPQKYLVEEANRLAVVREDWGFSIYADYPNFWLSLYIQLLLIQMSFTMVHAAGYLSPNGTATVVAGAGGIGKTAILGHAVAEKKLKHFGDDFIILSKSGTCLAFPRAFVLKSYHREVYSETFQRLHLPRRNFYQAKTFLVENAPFVGVGKRLLRRTGLYYRASQLLRRHSYLATVSPDEIFGKGTVASSANVGRVIYMERTKSSDFDLKPISKEQLSNRLCAVVHYEWKDYLNHFLTLGALNIIDFNQYLKNIVQTLDNALCDKELVHLCVPSAVGPEQLIEYFKSQRFF